MAEFDPFNATPTQHAENLFQSSMQDAYRAIHLTGSDKDYRSAIASSIGGICEGLKRLSEGLRATYLEIHKLNRKMAQIERAREIERFRKP